MTWSKMIDFGFGKYNFKTIKWHGMYEYLYIIILCYNYITYYVHNIIVLNWACQYMTYIFNIIS